MKNLPLTGRDEDFSQKANKFNNTQQAFTPQNTNQNNKPQR